MKEGESAVETDGYKEWQLFPNNLQDFFLPQSSQNMSVPQT